MAARIARWISAWVGIVSGVLWWAVILIALRAGAIGKSVIVHQEVRPTLRHAFPATCGAVRIGIFVWNRIKHAHLLPLLCQSGAASFVCKMRVDVAVYFEWPWGNSAVTIVIEYAAGERL